MNDVTIGLSYFELELLISHLCTIQDGDGYYNEPLDILIYRLKEYLPQDVEDAALMPPGKPTPLKSCWKGKMPWPISGTVCPKTVPSAGTLNWAWPWATR